MMKTCGLEADRQSARGLARSRWVRLRQPFTFNGFRFMVEVRARNGVVSAPGCHDDVRVRGPICARCGQLMALIESRPECERYACRHGADHCELWVGRVSHLSFAEFMREQLQAAAFHAITGRTLPLETVSIGRTLNLLPY
jgi:hypothetical protein